MLASAGDCSVAGWLIRAAVGDEYTIVRFLRSVVSGEATVPDCTTISSDPSLKVKHAVDSSVGLVAESTQTIGFAAETARQ